MLRTRLILHGLAVPTSDRKPERKASGRGQEGRCQEIRDPERLPSMLLRLPDSITRGVNTSARGDGRTIDMIEE
jgi:hypothetical protein